jgi:uncharacterized membrane protein YgcG
MPASTGGSSWSLSGSAATSVVVQLAHSGAHPWLLGRAGALPTLDSFDWPAAADAQVVDAQRSWTLVLSPGTVWYFGLYVYPGRAHLPAGSTLSLRVSVTADESGMVISPSFMSIILGVVLSMFLCLLMSVCKRYGVRWLVQRRHVSVWGDFGPGGMPGGPGAVRPRPPPARGLPRELIDQFPATCFAEGDIRKEDANCSVCLSDYEPGEMLRRLPVCSHCFHQSCIDEWLAAHQTCPLCRVSLLPAAPPEAGAAPGARSSSGGGGGGGEGYGHNSGGGGGGAREVQLQLQQQQPARARAPQQAPAGQGQAPPRRASGGGGGAAPAPPPQLGLPPPIGAPAAQQPPPAVAGQQQQQRRPRGRSTDARPANRDAAAAPAGGERTRSGSARGAQQQQQQRLPV